MGCIVASPNACADTPSAKHGKFSHGFIHMPADVNITEREVHVRFRRRAHLPIIAASGPPDEPVTVPWWNGMSLRMQALLPNDAATVLGKFFGVEIWASTKIDYCNPGGIRMLP